MDYGFAPGNTGQDKRVRRLFQRRTPPTTLVAKPNTVDEFGRLLLDALASSH